LERGDRRKARRNLRQKKDDQELRRKIRVSRGEGKKILKTTENLESNVLGYGRKNLRCTQKSSCSKDGEKMKMERRESAREGEREKSRSKTSFKPAMADYILSARPGSPAGPGPPGPFSSERWWGNGRETDVFLFSFFFWFFAFLSQCLGNSLVTWGKEMNNLLPLGSRWPKCYFF
jgi:hypothetical protein